MSSPLSLEDLSQQVLVHRPQQLQCSLPYIPGKLHSQLFSTAALLVPTSKQFRQLRQSIQTLIINWPHELFSIRQLLPEKQCQALLHAGTNVTLFQIIIDSLLTLNSSCRMSVADFAGVHVPTLFQLPLFSLPPDLLNTDYILEEIREKCKDFYDIEESQEDNLEYVLPWKLQEIKEKHKKVEYEGRAPLKVFADCQINLTDWVSMIDEMSALILQRHTPFRMVITKLSVESFHSRETAHLRWFLSMLNPEHLRKLVIYGKRKAIALVVWELQDRLKTFVNMDMFGLGTSGPSFRCLLNDHDPSPEEVLRCHCDVFKSWPRLQELYFIGVNLRGDLRQLLEGVPRPLHCITLHSCGLGTADIEYLVGCHHLIQLEEIGLQFNKLTRQIDLLIELILKATQLKRLDLKDTLLGVEEKVAFLSMLSTPYVKIEWLCLYENEDMLTVMEYQQVVELACAIPSLKSFYIFPFNFKPFEILLRAKVVPQCQEILALNGREDMLLQY